MNTLLLNMEEIVFVVKESEEGGYIASALGYSIITEGDTIPDLREHVREAVKCHFDDQQKRLIRLHHVKDEVFAA